MNNGKRQSNRPTDLLEQSETNLQLRLERRLSDNREREAAEHPHADQDQFEMLSATSSTQRVDPGTRSSAKSSRKGTLKSLTIYTQHFPSKSDLSLVHEFGPPIHLLCLPEDWLPKFTCPFSRYPNLVWLKGRHKRLIRLRFDAITNDDRTQCIVFSNRPQHIRRETLDGAPTMGLLDTRNLKRQRLPVLLTKNMEPFYEIVVTKLGGTDGFSDTLLDFARFATRWAEMCISAQPKGTAADT